LLDSIQLSIVTADSPKAFLQSHDPVGQHPLHTAGASAERQADRPPPSTRVGPESSERKPGRAKTETPAAVRVERMQRSSPKHGARFGER